MDLFECKKLHAKISEAQCERNRGRIISCQGCAGLGESAQVSLPVQEEVVKLKKIKCGREGCGYGVKKEGDFCKKHQEPVIIPVEDQKRGLDDGPLLPVRYVSDMTIEEIEATANGPICFGCNGPVNSQDLFCLACGGDALDKVAEEPPVSHVQENAHIDDRWEPDNSFDEVLVNSQVEKLPKLTGLQALLRTPPPPVEPDGLLIPFTREEVVELIESNVTAQDIRDLAMMLLAGELQRVAVV